MSPTERRAPETASGGALKAKGPEWESRFLGDSPRPALPGGVISNTPPPSSTWIAAEDWFEWCLYVDWRTDSWASFTEELEACKLWAAVSGSPEELAGWTIDVPRHALPWG